MFALTRFATPETGKIEAENLPLQNVLKSNGRQAFFWSNPEICPFWLLVDNVFALARFVTRAGRLAAPRLRAFVENFR